MSRYITTKANFTLRRKHKQGSGATIYENDYTTINPLPNALKGEYVIGDSNFVFTSRLGLNMQRKHTRGKFIPNPSGVTDERGAWTIETIVDSGITEETRIRLKPNYSSIRDFACYGSAVKLVQGTVNGVITDFPAELYFSDEDISFYGPDENKGGYSFNEENSGDTTGKLMYNEYGIDMIAKSIQEASVYNPLRYLALCGSSYTYIESGGSEYDFIGFDVTGTSSGVCFEGKEIQVDQLAKVELTFGDGETKEVKKTVGVTIFKDNDDQSVYYIYTGANPGDRIRPKKEIVEEYFRTCDDFTAVLLDRRPNPIYTATLETPKETDTGYFYEMKSYTWPTFNGGFNPDLSGAYYAYLQSLISLGEFYDEFYTDNMWRSLTHEAIKTLDWTYISNVDGEIEDMSTIDTSRIEPISKIYGRQFDDLKRYADAIKSSYIVTYDQKRNAPDYVLTDLLGNSGWETKVLKLTDDNSIVTDPLYSGLSYGYSSSDTDSEFLRRLKLNSTYLFSTKGTRKGLDAMMGMFGFGPEDYEVHEYVYVFKGKDSYPHFCADTEAGNCDVKYPLAKDVSTINKYKINFNVLDPYGDYCGIPVAEIGYWPDGSEGPNCSYVVPWFSQGKKYDDDLYFQKYGGWGHRISRPVNLEIASGITNLFEWDNVPLYMETQARLKFARDFDEMLQGAYASSHQYDVFYVTDVSKITTDYTPGDEDDISETGVSHYFVLENPELNQFLGYCDEGDVIGYGWRSINMSEIQEADTSSAGTLVLYLESIQDDTTGNNPHTGNGLYDDGMAYISGMSQIFNYSLINRNFIGINDDTCKKIKDYTFNVEKQEDNRKCWFFTEDYNTRLKRSSACTSEEVDTEFKEVDITEILCSDTGVIGGYGLDIQEVLTSGAPANAILSVGSEADGYMSSGYMTDESVMSAYTRGSELQPYNPELGTTASSGEAAANSIVNVKNIDIIFKVPSELSSSEQSSQTDDEKIYKAYIENTVVPYLMQMVPSTSILSWNFSGGSESQPERPTYGFLVTPKSASITENGTTTLKAYKITYINGVETKREDVSSKATWKITSGGDYATVNGGVVTGKNKQESSQTVSISVFYSSYSDTSSITVGAHTPVYTYEMRIEAERTSIEPLGTTYIKAYLTTKKDGETQGTEEITPTWSITSGQQYAVIAPDGKLTGTNTGATAQNVTVSARYTSPTGVLSQTVDVRVQGEAYIIPNPAVVTGISSAMGATEEFEIFTNLDWPITFTISDPVNFEVIGTVTKPQSTLIVRAKTENSDPTERRCTITFSDPRGMAEDAIVTVIQNEGKPPLVYPTVTMSADGIIPVPKEGGTATVTITVTDGTFDHYEVTPGVTVISVQRPNETTAIITLSFGANTTGEEVICTVTGYGRGVGYSTGVTSSETIEVPQTYSKWSLSDVDYVIFTYGWTEADGKDLDSFTFIDGLANSTADTYGRYFEKGVGYNNGELSDGEYYILPSVETSVLRMGGDNLRTGGEYTLVNFKQLNEDIIDAITRGEIAPNAKLIIYLMGNWYNTKLAGNGSISFEAYKGGEPVRVEVPESYSYKYVITGDTELKGTHTETGINVFAGGIRNPFSIGGQNPLNNYSSMAAFVYDYKYASFYLVTGEDLQRLASGRRYSYGRYYNTSGYIHVTGYDTQDLLVKPGLPDNIKVRNVDFTQERTYTINLDCNVVWATGSTPGAAATPQIKMVENSCSTVEPTSPEYDGDIILRYVNPTTFTVTFPAGHRYSGSSSGYRVNYKVDTTDEYVADYIGSEKYLDIIEQG